MPQFYIQQTNSFIYSLHYDSRQNADEITTQKTSFWTECCIPEADK